MTWFDTSSPGTLSELLVPRFQLRLNLTRFTSSPLSFAALDELGPSSRAQGERGGGEGEGDGGRGRERKRKRIPHCITNVLHACKSGASEDSVSLIEHAQWTKKPGNTLTQERPGG